MICLDSSLILKILTKEEGSEPALNLLKGWIKKEEILTAPLLAEYEVHSALRRKVSLGELEEFRVVASLDFFYKLHIEFVHGPEILREAQLLARQLDLSTIYDCCFLAVANQQGCPLYTADERFVKAAAKHSHPVTFYLEFRGENR